MKINVYRNYRFLDKDPIIDAMRTVVKSELGMNDSKAHQITGVSSTTFHNWFQGETRRPQNATASQAMAGLGYVRRDEMLADGTVVVGFAKARGHKWDEQEQIKAQADWLLKQGKKQKPRKRAKKNGANK